MMTVLEQEAHKQALEASLRKEKQNQDSILALKQSLKSILSLQSRLVAYMDQRCADSIQWRMLKHEIEKKTKEAEERL